MRAVALALRAHFPAECNNVSGTQSQTPTTLSVLMGVSSSGACKSKGLSTAAIAGIAVAGGLAVLALLVVVVLCIGLSQNWPWARRVASFKRKRPVRNGGVYA